MLNRLKDYVGSFGMGSVLKEGASRKLGFATRSFHLCFPLLKGKSGLEIGGPSRIFSRGGRYPLYPVLGHLDNCNYSRETIWEGAIQEGGTYRFDKDRPLGHQYVCEATDLQGIASESYDFVLSSHALEHVANPLRAVREWLRVLKPEGLIVIILPHKDGTFDHRRPVTPLAHLVEDFEKGTREDDLTHLPEVLEFHDLARDPGAGTLAEFKERSMNNFVKRAMHHHVFTTESLARILNHLELQIFTLEPILFFDIISCSRKLTVGRHPNNEPFLDGEATYRHQSPFPSDRI